MHTKLKSLNFLHSGQDKRATLIIESGMMICGIALMLSWPLDHTIALRNISLGVGFFLSIIWLFIVKPTIKLKNLAPFLLLCCVPIWLMIHLLLSPTSFLDQWLELKSLWLRVALGFPFAFSLGLIFNKKPVYSKVMASVCAIYPLIMLMMYVAHLVLGDKWAPAVAYIFKTKVAGTYFLMSSYLLGCALLHNLLIRSADKNQERQHQVILASVFYISLVASSIVGMILLNSLNGILIGLVLGLFLTLIYFKQIFWGMGKNKYLQLIIIAALAIVLMVVGSLYKTYSPDYQTKLVPIISDVKISLDIKKNQTWQRSAQTQQLPEPIRADGGGVNVSTYERTSWFIEGVNAFIALPLGTGYVSQSFHFHMSTKYPSSTVQKTHSGWLDLALGLGLPGLLCLWGAMIWLVVLALNNRGSQNAVFSIVALWMLGGMFLLWWPAELGEREFVESLFFVMTLFSGAVISLRPQFSYKM